MKYKISSKNSYGDNADQFLTTSFKVQQINRQTASKMTD